jgi:hypothetical protein
MSANTPHPIGSSFAVNDNLVSAPQIADFVVETIHDSRLSLDQDVAPSASLHLIDLAVWKLPLFDEPTIPSQVHHYSGYGQPHTQAWGVEIQKYQGFISVLP